MGGYDIPGVRSDPQATVTLNRPLLQGLMRLVDATSASKTEALSNIPHDGELVIVKKTDSSENTVTVTDASGNTLATLYSQNEVVRLYYTSGAWYLI